MLFILITTILIPSVVGTGCCKSKMSGGKSYTFLGEEDTSAFKCIDKCTYSEDGKPGTKVCFAAGDLETKCKDASTASTATTGAAMQTSGAEGSSTATAKVTWPLKTSTVSRLPKYTTVFGIPVFGDSSLSDLQFQHIASVLAAWMDNDQDGCVDNPTVLTKLITAKPQPAVVAPGPGDGGEPPADVIKALETKGYFTVAPVFNGELLLNCSGPKATDQCADASLEEILHMITDQGFAKAWPDVFSTNSSQLTKAMDVARGGKFLSIPSKYPSSAWYTYYDKTCDYKCQVTEYIYWGISAWVGSIQGRAKEISQEWKLENRVKLTTTDKLMTSIIQNTAVYKMPNVSPTGVYSAPSVCASGGQGHS